MMGRLSARNKSLLKNCMKAIVKNDIYEVERTLVSMSVSNYQIDHTKLRIDIEQILDKNATTNINDINTMEFINSMFNMLRKHNLKLDRNITMLIRGIGVIEGSLESVSPNINLFMVLSNKIREESINELMSKDTISKAGRDILSLGNSLPKIPNELLNLITDINRGETKFDIEMTNSDRQIDKLESMLHQIIIGVLDAALLLGASMVESEILRNIYFIAAFILSLWLIIKMLVDYFHKGM